jgi:hypothetical protein
VQALKDSLPVNARLSDQTVRNHSLIDASIKGFEETYPKFNQLAKAVMAFRTSIVRNGRFTANCHEHWRYRGAIATGSVESTANVAMSTRFCDRQCMQWPGKSSGQGSLRFSVLSIATASVVLPLRNLIGLSS